MRNSRGLKTKSPPNGLCNSPSKCSRRLLRHMGFSERRGGGSHRIFYKEGVEEIINLQPRGGQGKPYQMKQIRQILLRYKLSAK